MWRWLLAVFVVALGLGYLAAVACTFGQTELVDGQPGMSARDLILKFHGGYESVADGNAGHSRLLVMASTEMRDEFSSDAHFEVLKGWLDEGGREDRFAVGSPISPKAVLEADCTHCHSADSAQSISITSPFGPDAKSASYAMVAKFTTPTDVEAGTTWRSPTSWRHLAVTTHVHLFAVPILTVIMGALFLWAGWPKGDSRVVRRLRTAIAVAPMAFFLGDVSCWWLARLPAVGSAFALVIGCFGALFGIAYVTQWSVIMVGLSQPASLLRTWPFYVRDRHEDGMPALRSAAPRWSGPSSARRGGTNVEDDPLAVLSAEEQVRELAAMLRDAAHAPARSPQTRSEDIEKFGMDVAPTDDRRYTETAKTRQGEDRVSTPKRLQQALPRQRDS